MLIQLCDYICHKEGASSFAAVIQVFYVAVMIGLLAAPSWFGASQSEENPVSNCVNFGNGFR